jgi:aspartate/methionine/tyrosine aminotransferase
VALTSGVDFDEHRGGEFLRVSFAGSPAQMREACRRLQAWYAAL